MLLECFSETVTQWYSKSHQQIDNICNQVEEMQLIDAEDIANEKFFRYG